MWQYGGGKVLPGCKLATAVVLAKKVTEFPRAAVQLNFPHSHFTQPQNVCQSAEGRAVSLRLTFGNPKITLTISHM